MSTIIPNQNELNEQQKNQPNEQNLFQELQSINPIILLKQPQLFKQTFNQIIELGQKHIKSKDFQKGITILNKTIQMLDFGKNILKNQISSYLKLTIFANLAYAYQVQRKLQKCNRFCQKTKEQLQRLIIIVKNQENSIQKYLKLSKFLVTLKFQHCAIISQLQQHQKALQMCKSTVPQIKEQIKTMLKHLQQITASKISQKKSGQTVQFSRHVKKFSQNLLEQLLNFINEPLKKCHFYHWQKNIEQNQQQIKKKFIPFSMENKNQCKRSILGVSKSTHWIDQFNIGSIMHMSMVTVQDFQTILPMQEYFFKDKLYQIVILCSLSYFTMATQIRFIQPSKDKEKKPQQNIQNNNDNQNQKLNKQIEQNKQKGKMLEQSNNISTNILKKYGYEQRSQLFKLSQLYHLRAIEIVSKNIQSVIPYLSHIIKSFQKHYLKKKQLQPIIAIQQQSFLSNMNQSMFEYLPQQKIYNDYINKQQVKTSQQRQNINGQVQVSNLLIHSQQNNSIPLISKNNSQKLGSDKSKHSGDQQYIIDQIKHVIDFNQLKNIHKSQISAKKKYKNQIDSIINKQGCYTSRSYHQENLENQHLSNQYLQSKKFHNYSKNKKITSSKDIKKSKSNSNLNLNLKLKLKSKNSLQKNLISSQKSPRLKLKQQKQKNLYTFRSQDSNKQSKRNLSNTHNSQNQKQKIKQKQKYLKNKDKSNDKGKIIKTNIKSPQINKNNIQSSKRISIKSKQKILKKFINVPQSIHTYRKKQSQQNDKIIQLKKKQSNHTKQCNNKQKQQQKKKQSKFYTKYEGQKEYRIKHQSTTHIKVLYKKKD